MKLTNPYDAWGFLSLPGYKRIFLKVILGLARLFKFWCYPRQYDPDVMSFWNGCYWVYKNIRPFSTPEKGSGLTAYFQHHRIQFSENLEHSNLSHENISKSLDLRFVGDLMNAQGLENSQNFFYERVADDIFAGDLSVANFESTLSAEPVSEVSFKSGENPKINSTKSQYLTIKGHHGTNYSIFHMANNHVLDNGLEGFAFTHKQLIIDGIAYFGTNMSKDCEGSPLIYNQDGFKLGFIGFTYSLNNRVYPDDKSYLVNKIEFHKPDFQLTELSSILGQIKKCKEARCDFIIVSLHWGKEFEFYPTPSQVDVAHKIAEAGADFIVSHHAHVIQFSEIYSPKAVPSKEVPICYGLGNLSSIFSSEHCVLSLILRVSLCKTENNGHEKTHLKSIRLTPVFQKEIWKEGKLYLQIVKLCDEFEKISLHPSIFDLEWVNYVKKIAFWADLVIGKTWREGKTSCFLSSTYSCSPKNE